MSVFSPRSENVSPLARFFHGVCLTAFVAAPGLPGRTAVAMTCTIQNSSPYAPSGHMSPTLELSPQDRRTTDRSVRLATGSIVPLKLEFTSDATDVYTSVDPSAEIRVETKKVGNVERGATVSVGRAATAIYVCN